MGEKEVKTIDNEVGGSSGLVVIWKEGSARGVLTTKEIFFFFSFLSSFPLLSFLRGKICASINADGNSPLEWR